MISSKLKAESSKADRPGGFKAGKLEGGKCMK